MKKYIFYLLAFSLMTFSYGQNFDMKWLKEIGMRNIGPSGMSGRITAIDVVHSNPDIMFAGSASGGLWKSTSRGIEWVPIFNDQITASIGAIAIQQSNPSVLWVGTGEGNPRNSLNGGAGIFKSLDGGKSWKSMGLEKTRHIHRIIIDPTDANTIYVAAIGSPWGIHSERGVYKTTNGGKSWKKVLYVNQKTGAADLVMDPSNPNKLIAAMWEHKRDPWFFKSGGKGSGLYVTFDGGETWKKRTDEEGLPKGELGRIGISIAPSNPNIIYALVEAKKNALYKSVDGGFKWNKINDNFGSEGIGNRPFYYSDLSVDPENENRVYSVFTFVNVSEDGGKSFNRLVKSYGVDNGVHPDHHAWWVHPKDGSFLINGNDGGLNISYDRGKNWRFIGNIPVAQFYHINVDNDFPYNVYGGMQDNGSWRGPAYVWKYQGIRNSYWQEISFGDGFDVIPDKNNSTQGYSMSQQGYVVRYDANTGNSFPVRPTHPDPDVKLRFNWNAAIGQDPFDENTVYFGSQFVHKSTDKGLTWSVISPDLTTNDKSKQKQHESGGITLDATGAENYCTLLVVEPSPIKKDMLWAASDDGRVHVTMDGGKNWSDVSATLKGLPKGSWITQIKASNKNEMEALLVANNYRRFDYTPYAYRTKDGGETWERIVSKEDVKSFALSIVEDIENPNLLFLGTDDGLYISFNAGSKWQKMDSEVFPTVSTKDLAIQPREHDLIVGTFGRAAWVLDDIRPLRALAKNPAISQKKVHFFSTPTAYLASYLQPTGSRFPGDAEYKGENRKGGAMITYFLTPDKKKKEDATKKEDKEKKEDSKENEGKDTLFVKIFKGAKLIRTLQKKITEKDKKGLHRIYWNMREKGIRPPSREYKKEVKGDSSGKTVLPGEYTIVGEYNGETSKTTLTVESDPRLEVQKSFLEEVYTYGSKIENMYQTLKDAVNQLALSKKTAKNIKSQLNNIDKEKYKDEIKKCSDIVKLIDENIDLYLGKKDDRQGIVRNPEINVSNRIQTASYYVATRKSGVTDTEKKLIENAENHLNEVLEKTNTFFENDWKAFKDSIQNVSLLHFNETKQFKTVN